MNALARDWRVARARAEELLKRFDPSQPRDENGQWTDGGGSDDRGGGGSVNIKEPAPPSPVHPEPPAKPRLPKSWPKEDDGTAKKGDEITVLRMAERDRLAGRNAGNAGGVAVVMVRLDGDGPRYAAQEKSDTIYAYRVKLTEDTGDYARANVNTDEAVAQQDRVGREAKEGGGEHFISYSFPKDGSGYEHATLSSISMEKVNAKLKEWGYYGPDDAGTLKTTDAIREAFAESETEHEHPGEGYTQGSFVKNSVIHTDNVYDAVKALYEDRDVELSQPRQVSVLINKLGEISKEMIAKGEKAPNFNLCRVTLSGTSLFCADTHGIPRVQMPQLVKEQDEPFRKHLEDKGYRVEKQEQFASYLRATQNELNGAKVAAIAAKMRRPEGYHLTGNPIFVSNDDYILDGHHRWAAEIGNDAADNKLANDKKMAIWRVNISITQLLKEADLFTGGKGKLGMMDERKKQWLALRARSEALLKRFDPSQPRDEYGKWTDGGGGDDSADGASERVSTTTPSAAKQNFDPHKVNELSPSYKTFKHALENPKFAAGVDKLMERYGKSFMRLPKGATTAQKVEAFVAHAKSNITALYDAQNPALRGRSATWYRGANKIAKDFAKQYGVSPRAVAGVMASLSPQRDWDQNVELAKRVLDVAVANGKIPIEGTKAANTKTAMLDYAKQQRVDADKIEAKLPENPDPKDPAVRGQLLKIENRREMADDIEELANNFEGKTLSQIKGRAQQAIILRFYDEGNADPDRSYAIWNPEGTPSGEVAMAGKPGKEKVRQAGWGAFPMTANALSILGDDSIPNISAMLGDNHKIRNFYNNIISPEYGRDTTIDTHAVAAALMMPLGGGAAEVKEGLGMSGPKNAETGLKALYALYTEAYRRASEEKGVLPREMQSTTWEALRGLFSPEEKRDVKLEAAVKDTWTRYKQGKIDLAAAQKEILARGIKPPRWAK